MAQLKDTIITGDLNVSNKIYTANEQLTGQITKAGINTSWNKGRNNAALAMTSLSGYSPCISIKTTNGSWDIGTYDNSSYTDRLVFSYIADTLYNSSTANYTGQVAILGGGHFYTTGYYYGNGSQLTGLTKSQINGWVDNFTCTLLWTNSNVGSSFAAQTVYLSQSAANFKLLLISKT